MSSALRFAVPSLNPMRLRAVCCARDVDDVRPYPSWDQRTLTTPKPIRARLRTAWTATCGSLAHACTQMSPPEISGLDRVAGKVRQVGQRRRSLSGEAEPVRARRRRGTGWPEADRQRELRGRQAEGLARVIGRRLGNAADRAEHTGVAAGRHPGGGDGPLLQQVDELPRGRRCHVERRRSAGGPGPA